MPIIRNKQAVLAIYEEARNQGWVLPCFCSENLTTTEAVLEATREYGEHIGMSDLPIILAITAQYGHRTQAAYYTQSRRWDIGLKLFLADLDVLTSPGSPYESLRVMIHLDHIQFDEDAALLEWDMGLFSSIMFDASKISFSENVALTRKFVLEKGEKIVVEGACDEIVDATGAEISEMTTPEKALFFCEETGVDLIVANLGTEHRASAKDLLYHGDLARSIKLQIGSKIVLHGASSVPGEQMEHLMEDGVCKVNIWTALERDASPALFTDMVKHAVKVAGTEAVGHLMQDDYLGLACTKDGKASLDYFTTTYRQTVIFEEMKQIVTGYLQLWYRMVH